MATKGFFLFPDIYLHTFKEKELDEVIGEENTHRCKIHPCEAAIYSLQGKGKNLETFRSISRAELSVDVEEKKKNFSVEIPVNFSKEDLAKVKNMIIL